MCNLIQKVLKERAFLHVLNIICYSNSIYLGNPQTNKPPTPRRDTEITKCQVSPVRFSTNFQESTESFRESTNSPLMRSQKSHHSISSYDSNQRREEFYSQPQSARKGEHSPLRDRDNNSSLKISRERSIEHLQRKKNLTGDTKINLGSYIILRVIMNSKKRRVLNRILEAAKAQTALKNEAKMYKSVVSLDSDRKWHVPLSDRKERPSPQYYGISYNDRDL